MLLSEYRYLRRLNASLETIEYEEVDYDKYEEDIKSTFESIINKITKMEDSAFMFENRNVIFLAEYDNDSATIELQDYETGKTVHKFVAYVIDPGADEYDVEIDGVDTEGLDSWSTIEQAEKFVQTILENSQLGTEEQFEHWEQTSDVVSFSDKELDVDIPDWVAKGKKKLTLSFSSDRDYVINHLKSAYQKYSEILTDSNGVFDKNEVADKIVSQCPNIVTWILNTVIKDAVYVRTDYLNSHEIDYYVDSEYIRICVDGIDSFSTYKQSCFQTILKSLVNDYSYDFVVDYVARYDFSYDSRLDNVLKKLKIEEDFGYYCVQNKDSNQYLIKFHEVPEEMDTEESIEKLVENLERYGYRKLRSKRFGNVMIIKVAYD